MVLDLNRLPYFDDYNEDKGFHRILFKPGLAVQARELTQLQTILQDQIEKFGNHVFDNGTRVLGGKFDVKKSVDYVRVQTGITGLTASDMIGAEITGSVSRLKANVFYAESDPNEVGVLILFIGYSDNNSSTEVTTFQSETITFTLNSTNYTLSTTTVNITGKSTIFGISEGIYYAKGFFVKFDSQRIAVDPLNENANKKVYFKANFSIVDSNQDTSLLDNAQGFNNFNAPGADRLKCELSLVTSDLDESLEDEENYLLLEIRNGIVYQENERTQYSELYKELAKRTFDESGDYVVNGWDVFTTEHLNTGTNGGRYSLEEGGNSDKLMVNLEKGLGYVKGYEVGTISTRQLETDKSLSYEFVDEQYAYVQSGPYIEVQEIVGLPDPDATIEINLYDTAENRITNAIAYNTSPSGNTIGTARLGSYIEESGQFGQADGVMRLYVHDIKMTNNNSFADVKAVGSSDFFADTVLNASNNAVLLDTAGNSKLFYVGSNYVRTVKDDQGASDMSIVFARQSEGTVQSTGDITGIVETFTNESLPYGTGTLASLAKETIFLTVTSSLQTTNLTGTVSTTSGNATVTGSGTSFTNLNENDKINVNGTLYVIDTITNDTQLTLTTNASATVSGASYSKIYIAGDLIDLSSKGATTGTQRTVTASSSALTIDLNETYTGTASCKLTYRVKKETVNEVQKSLVKNNIVLIDGSTANTEITEGLTKFYLGFSDVYRVREVRKSSSAFTAIDDGTDVTADFDFYNGQTGTSYNTAYIKTDTAIQNSEYLLIKFDYFEPDFTSGESYFTIDSYPVDDTQADPNSIPLIGIPSFNGLNLRNTIDCRPVREPTANTSTTISGATTNPTNSTTYYAPLNGMRIPVPGTSMIYDYSYYLARRDVLVVDNSGYFKIIQGDPAVVPPFPKVSDSYMKIANLYIPPYPSLSKTYAKIIGNPGGGVQVEKLTIDRHTMRDIGNIKQRVKNLEYYNALNILERNTLDLLIPDENGLDRFKNGVFIDPFNDHSFADAGHRDYNIAVDKKTKEIRPAFTLEGFDTNYSSGSSVIKLDNLVSLTFTEQTLLSQLYATTTRNVEFASFRYIGDLTLTPNIDTWVDSSTVDRTIEVDSGLPEELTLSTDWGAWERVQSGAISGQPVENSEFALSLANDVEASNVSIPSGTSVSVIIASTNVNIQAASLEFIANPDATNTNFESRTFSSAAEANAWVNSQRQRLQQEGGAQVAVITNNEITNVETIVETRQGIENILVSEERLTELGSFVTDVSIVPYIRPQVIKLYAQGLKANTRYYVFFDGVNMDSFVQPGLGAAEGDPLFSNENGIVTAFLRLPAGVDKRFRVGEREVVVTDNRTNDKAASSYASATFVASGLNQQKQNTILSTQALSVEQRSVSETRETQVTSTENVIDTDFTTITPPPPPPQPEPVEFDCSAYSFYVDVPEDNEGVFLSSIEVWFSQFDANLGVWFEIREMTSSGTVGPNVVPFSKVWMERDDPRLLVSEDGVLNPTKINYDSPIFLYNKTQYAFVIHTIGPNPNTYFWVSRIGGIDVESGNPVNTSVGSGTFFESTNNKNWDIVSGIDLKFRVNIADFAATPTAPRTGTATFINEDVEFISDSSDLPSNFFYDGEPVKGSEILNISLDGANTVIVGDIILDGTSNTSANVVSIVGTDIYTDNHDFVVGANVEIQTSGGAPKETGTIESVEFGLGIVEKIDRDTNRFDIINSNGKFFVGSELRSLLANRHVLSGDTFVSQTISGLASSTTPNPYFEDGNVTIPEGQAKGTSGTFPTYTISAFTTYDYTASTFRPGFLNFSGTTTLSFDIKTVEGTTVGSYGRIVPNQTYEYNSVKNILSRSEEVRLLNGEKSFTIRANLGSTSEYLSPIVDSSLMGGVFVLNSLNDDTTNENLPYGGALESKYISRQVVLTEENESEDLLVILDEYRPATANVKVWARIKSKYDQESLNDKEWFELSTSKAVVSSSINKNNFIETRYSIPSDMLTGSFGEVQYTSGDGVQYTGYNSFQLKIGMVGSNRAVYPKAAKLRAIALQV